MRFLLICDDRSLAASLKEALEGKEHEVAVKGTRSLGNRRLLADNPDVLIFDWVDLDARRQRAYRRLRERSKVAAVMLLAGRSVDEGEEADAYLVKPIDIDRLLVRAEMVTSGEAPDRLQCGDLLLDMANSLLIRGENTQRLTPKQLQLLATLMQNAGEVLSRKVLMTKVWNTDYPGDTRTLDVHICWLRKKMESNPSEPQLLRTVRGVGYCFTGEACAPSKESPKPQT